jgi:hypothetical protein
VIYVIVGTDTWRGSWLNFSLLGTGGYIHGYRLAHVTMLGIARLGLNRA